MSSHDYAVIMAGGIGERFWPMSRTTSPKQFIDILGTGKTLIRQTYERFLQTCPAENIYILTNEQYQGLVLEQIPGITPERIITEPTRKNTAPCIAYAAYKLAALDPEARMVVAPSDHIILKEDIFTRLIRAALDAAAENEHLYTLGITPSRPDTGYGYIQYLNEHNGRAGYQDTQSSSKSQNKDIPRKVKTFTEKPNAELARSFIESGDFLWNSGIFIWSAKTIINAFEEFQPEISDVFREGIGKYNGPEEKPYMDIAYHTCKSISIDYAIMEKARNVFVFEADFDWSDLGTWGSLFEARPRDENNNAVIGQHVLMYDSSACIVNMPHDKVVVIQGLTDYIVAESGNALLICPKSQEQQIRKFVNDIRLKKGNAFV